MNKYKSYPKYKDSGVEYMKKIPSDWKMGSLSKLFNIKAGGDLKLEYFSSDKSEKHQYPIYTNATTDEVVYGYTSKSFYESNTITVSGRGDVGFAVYRDHSYDAIIRLLVLSPIKKYLCKFFTYFINAVIDFKVESSAIGQLSTQQISPYKVAIPPLPEQRTIAAFLDYETGKIDELIKKQQDLIALLEEKRQAVISHAVTKGLNPNAPMKDSGIKWLGEVPEHWEVSKLRYSFTFGKGLTITKANLKDKGIPCVNYGEIHSKYGFAIDPTVHTLRYVDEQYIESSPNSLLANGDFVFADTSEDIEGSGNFTQLWSSKAIFAGYHTVIVRPDVGNDNRFLAYVFDSLEFRTQIRYAVKGVKVFSITQAILRNANVWFPTLPEQQKISIFLDNETKKIDDIIDNAKSAIELMQERRTALISAAVTGKIDVRDFNI